MPTTFESDTQGRSAFSLAGCVQLPELFQDPLLEEPPTASGSAASRRRYAALERQAEAVCRSCPLLTACLYRAVVRHDIAGFVAGTTKKQRLEMRAQLAISVAPEDFDTLAGVTRHHRQVDHDEVLRLRDGNPHESLEQLAQRLGCSLSTVKRHLRRERQSPGTRRHLTRRRPSQADVLAVSIQLSAGRWLRQNAA